MLTVYWAPFKAEAVEAKVWVRETQKQVFRCSFGHVVLYYLTSLCSQVSKCEGNDIVDFGTTNRIAGIPRY